MFKRGVVFFCILAVSVSLAGCATTRRPKEFEIQGLRNQVSVLESQLQSKDEEISSLKDQLNSQLQEKEISSSRRVKVIAEAKYRPSIRQIQKALKNAGYNPGTIDGRMGRETKDAIRAFQRANGLKADGKAGRNTWKLLKKYLYQKTK
jgi:murein L,D-transpeptidase YcbB/YkuD